MSTPSVRYSKLGQEQKETTVFDYSSPFSYESTDPKTYKSIFEYKTPIKLQEYDIQKNRGESKFNKLIVIFIFLVKTSSNFYPMFIFSLL